LTKGSQIGLLILLGLLMAASYVPEYVKARDAKPPATKIACPDFPPVDGAGRPAICDEK